MPLLEQILRRRELGTPRSLYPSVKIHHLEHQQRSGSHGIRCNPDMLKGTWPTVKHQYLFHRVRETLEAIQFLCPPLEAAHTRDSLVEKYTARTELSIQL